MKKAFLVVLLTICCYWGWATMFADTTISGFNGHYQQISRSNGAVFSFASAPQKSINNNTFLIKELHINGQLNKELLNEGVWLYNFKNYAVTEPKITRSATVRMNYKLNGEEKRWKMSFKNNRVTGRVQMFTAKVLNGYPLKDDLTGEAQFDTDTLKGDFILRDERLGSAKGRTDQDGFLDGTIELSYVDGEMPIDEKRVYENGFLLSIEKRNGKTNEVLENIVYEDVSKQLNLHKSDIKETYAIADEWFGATFNFGYQSSDKKIRVQQAGNNLLTLGLQHFFKPLADGSATKFPVLKLTKRFEFLYDSHDAVKALALSERIDSFKSEIDLFISKPGLLLRKGNSNVIERDVLIMERILDKLSHIEDVVYKIKSGYFQYAYRDKYYENGIPDLVSLDTAVAENMSPYIFKHAITSGNNLVYQLENLVDELKGLYSEMYTEVERSLYAFENQERIDSLDNVIALLEIAISDNFTALHTTEKDEVFSQTLRQSLEEKFIEPLKKQYLSKTSTQHATIETGEMLICYQRFLDKNASSILNIQQLPAYWSDSLFTIYRDNPFYHRKLESKVLTNIEGAANILLKQYANDLLNAKSCEQLTTDHKKITRLNDRLKFLSANMDNENVIKLDKALRRERVPNRIERYFEL